MNRQAILRNNPPPIGRKRGFFWEREFAKKLSLWWTNGKDKYVFRRSHGSGSAYQDREGLSGAGGDIVSDKEIGFPFTNIFHIECKESQRTDIILLSLFLKDTLTIGSWNWMKLRLEAKKFNRTPFLVLKPFRKKEQFIFVNKSAIEKELEKYEVKYNLAWEGKELLAVIRLQEFFRISPLSWKKDETNEHTN